MIVTPVNWYQVSSPVKLDDGSLLRGWRQSDPTSHRARCEASPKALELQGWNYPRHLAGALLRHRSRGRGGGENVRRSLSDLAVLT